mmetsp:Transcript_88300/g.175505  ORF Transcript_88300/g.175505 Transcript_88300/m.175505 type:complete len:245 (-) Transcript_88300:54-788(-)
MGSSLPLLDVGVQSTEKAPARASPAISTSISEFGTHMMTHQRNHITPADTYQNTEYGTPMEVPYPAIENPRRLPRPVDTVEASVKQTVLCFWGQKELIQQFVQICTIPCVAPNTNLQQYRVHMLTMYPTRKFPTALRPTASKRPFFMSTFCRSALQTKEHASPTLLMEAKRPICASPQSVNDRVPWIVSKQPAVAPPSQDANICKPGIKKNMMMISHLPFPFARSTICSLHGISGNMTAFSKVF